MSDRTERREYSTLVNVAAKLYGWDVPVQPAVMPDPVKVQPAKVKPAKDHDPTRGPYE